MPASNPLVLARIKLFSMDPVVAAKEALLVIVAVGDSDREARVAETGDIDPLNTNSGMVFVPSNTCGAFLGL